MSAAPSPCHRAMRLISWNVAGRLRRIDAQVAALAGWSPDLIALQEVTTATLDGFRRALPDIGLTYIAHSLELTRLQGRRYGQVVASRWPLLPLQGKSFEFPFPERVLSVQVEAPRGPIEIHTAHVVPGSPRVEEDRDARPAPGCAGMRHAARGKS